MSQGLPGDHRWRLAPPKLLRVDMRQVWLFGELARLPGVECRVYCDQTPLKLSCCVAIMAYWLKPPSIPEMKIVWAPCDMSYSGEVQTRKHTRLTLYAGALMCFVGTGWAALNLTVVPWFWIGACGLALAVVLLYFDRNKLGKPKWFWFNVACCCLVLLLCEFICYLHYNRTHATEVYSPPLETFIRDDPILGYVLRSNARTHVSWMWRDQRVHEATYTTDAHGFRAGPSRRAERGRPVVFMGCSITFGSGLEDEQTISCQVEELTEGRYQCYNLGVFGYGTHQCYAQLKNGLVDEAVGGERPRAIIYQAIMGHASRASGRLPWNCRGPRFVIDDHGELRYCGTLEQARAQAWQQRCVLGRWARTAIAESFVKKDVYDRFHVADAEGRHLQVALIERMRDEIAGRYPDCEFHIIFWDCPGPDRRHNDWFVGQVEQKGIVLHRIRDILPDYEKGWVEYTVAHPVDNHPNASAVARLAGYIIAHILKEGEHSAHGKITD